MNNILTHYFLLSYLVCISLFGYTQEQQSNFVEEISIEQLTDNPQALKNYMKAEDLFDRGKYKRAIKFFTLAYQADSSLTIALDNIALSYRRNYKMDKAVEYYKKSLQIEPNNRIALNNLGLVYVYLEQFENAIQTYTTLLEMHPNDAQGMYNFALTYLYAKQFDLAVTYADAAFKIWKDTDRNKAQDAVYLVCRIYIEAENKDAAREYFREAAREGVRNNNARRDFGL